MKFKPVIYFQAEIGSGSCSDYPGTKDTDNTLEVNQPNAGKTKARAEVVNDLAACIVAIEGELGTDPAGTLADVATFLQTEHGTDGTHSNLLVGMLAGTQTFSGNKTFSGSTTFSGTLAGAGWPSFSVHKNGSNQTSVGTALELVTWSTEEFDTNSDFASNKFTPTVAGKYFLTAALEFEIDADANNIGISIYKNGAAYKTRYESAANTGPRSISISVVSSANGTTDYFEVYAANTTTADTIDGTASLSYFQGCRIG